MESFQVGRPGWWVCVPPLPSSLGKLLEGKRPGIVLYIYSLMEPDTTPLPRSPNERLQGKNLKHSVHS